jgi:hypothetical protein
LVFVLEIDDLQGFKSLIEETKSENKINNFDVEDDDNNNNNNNNNNNFSYPEPSNVGEKKKLKRSSDTVDLLLKREFYHLIELLMKHLSLIIVIKIFLSHLHLSSLIF